MISISPSLMGKRGGVGKTPSSWSRMDVIDVCREAVIVSNKGVCKRGGARTWGYYPDPGRLTNVTSSHALSLRLPLSL